MPDLKSTRTRARIVRSAAEAIAEKGYASTSLADIARRADLKVGSLYYHFAAKDELVAEVIRTGTREVHDSVVAAIDTAKSDSPVDRIRVAITAHLQGILAEGSHARANLRSYGQFPPKLAALHRQVERAYGALWRTLLEDAVASGDIRSDLDPAAMRLMLIGALNWSVEWFDVGGALTPAELGQNYATMILDGLIVVDGEP